MKRATFCLATILSVHTMATAQIVISDNFNVTSVGSGFVLGEGVNSGITPPTTRLGGSAAADLRYISRAGKPDTAFLITSAVNGRFRVNNDTGNARVTFSNNGTDPFSFGTALGIGAAAPGNRVEYDIKFSMDNNSSGTHRMSFGLGTIESDANNWDFGLQLHKAAAGNDFYTVSKRVDSLSSGVPDRNDSMLTMGAGTAGTEVSFVIRVTDAGAETEGYNSRVRVSNDNGVSWFYDSATDTTALPNGLRFDGGERYFSFDVAGNNSSFVTYNDFSVEIVPEPSTFALAGLGGAALLFFGRRFKNPVK